MKRFMTFLVGVLLVAHSIGQPASLVTRCDTIQVKPGDDGWMVGNGSVSLGTYLLREISSGSQKAFDPLTNEQIPATMIYSWRMSADTIMLWDEKKQQSLLQVVQTKIEPDDITRVRVYLGWKIDPSNGRLEILVDHIELVRSVYSSMGTLIGQAPYCSIRYDP